MAGKMNKRVKNSSRMKQTVVSRKKKGDVRKGPGLGRFVLGIVFLALLYHFAISPAVHSIQAHPIFTVRRVAVDGARYINSEEIIKAADVEMGQNIFDVDIQVVSERLKSAFAAEDFTVFRSLPATITVSIHEKQPVALLNAERLIGVDKNGDPLPHIGADLVESLPIVTGIKHVRDLSDSTVKARLMKGLSMLETIKVEAPSTYQRISELHVATMNELGISLVDNGLEVIIGDRDWSRKIPIIDRVINEVTSRRKEVKAVDIRFGEVVVIKK